MEKERPKIVAIDVVVIGSSTGGPVLLENILKELPENFPAAVLIVQHMPKHFTSSFSKRLEKMLKIRIKEAEEGDVVETGVVFLAPGDSYMTVKQVKDDEHGIRKVICLQEKLDHGPLDSIDTTMWSVAEVYGSHVVGLILSGMGEDGRLGIRAIKSKGGYAMIQDPKTAVVGSMPSAVIEDGLADAIVETKDVPGYLVKLFS